MDAETPTPLKLVHKGKMRKYTSSRVLKIKNKKWKWDTFSSLLSNFVNHATDVLDVLWDKKWWLFSICSQHDRDELEFAMILDITSDLSVFFILLYNKLWRYSIQPCLPIHFFLSFLGKMLGKLKKLLNTIYASLKPRNIFD